MSFLILILFDLVIMLMLWIDTRHYGNIITPFSVIGFMYLILININDLFAVPTYSFYAVSGTAKLLLFVFLLVTFLIDLGFGYYLKQTGEAKRTVSLGPAAYYAVCALFLIGLLAYLVSFLRLYMTYGLSIKGQNNGVLGHLSYLAFVLAPLFLYMTLKQTGLIRKVLAFLAVLAVFGIALLFGGKYVVFINLCYFIFFFILISRKKIHLRSIIIVGLLLAAVAVLIFIVLYLVVPRVTGQYTSSLDFAVEHFFYYLLSPVIANNYTLTHPGAVDPLIPVAFFVNLIRAFTGGSYVDTILGFDFRSSPLEVTNVSGLYGELTYSSGIIGALCYVVLIFTLINIVYVKCRKNGRYPLTTGFCLAILAFSFFANMFSNSGIVEPLILVFLAETVIQNVETLPFVFRPLSGKGMIHGMDRT